MQLACNASATESAFQGQKNIQLDNDSITRAFNCLSFVEGFIRCIPISPCLVIISFTYFYLGWGDQGVPGPSIFGLIKPSVFLTKSLSRFVSVVLHSVLLPPHLTVSLYLCRSRSNIQSWVPSHGVVSAQNAPRRSRFGCETRKLPGEMEENSISLTRVRYQFVLQASQ